MSVWHGDLRKRKASGGRKKSHRAKRIFESGSFPTETILGETKKKFSRRHGGNRKIRLMGVKSLNVSNPHTGETQKVEIVRVLKNPANLDYNRRGVVTKGTIIKTSLGNVRVTSRPGQHGVVNAILVTEKDA